ncbi:TIGR03620 family F420-dependent LLM class oxidoreductase [Rhodococcus sp. IEGM 1330]|uniref:TIGR03620 family F420-dependent LLM class oxidoreductase n=1 Tax=Rhodococcus sp. IEGM 1330 TaxID=3082225 RepID=UPI0029554EF4|nr:TIGR03620 family F420-dependent LLM class oxidoreductase [Rhodococcus sp. IEGM 1330]MDV8021992.1 TIGR03620 family F420-dependent LLM class oxidoreductase [Rhodococcus sp. IEGM 1330]
MDTLNLGRIGISIDVSPSYLDDARTLESYGYTALWPSGGQIDRLGRLVDLVRATETATIVPGIVPVDVYTPSQTGELFDELSPTGRFVLGLGGPQSARPLAGLHRYLDELAVPAGRILLAALGPKKLEMARDRAGGAIGLLVTPEWTAQARHSLGTAELVVDQFVVVESDPDRARAAARKPLSFLATVPGYRQNFVRMGFTDADIDQLSDRLVDALVVWGSVEGIASRVASHHKAGADHVVLAPLGASSIDAGRALSELVVSSK